MQPPRHFQQGIPFSRSCLVKAEQRLHVLYRGEQAAVFKLGESSAGWCRGYRLVSDRVMAVPIVMATSQPSRRRTTVRGLPPARLTPCL